MDILPVPNAVSLIATALFSIEDIRHLSVRKLPALLFLSGGFLYGLSSGSGFSLILSALPGVYVLSAALLTGEKIGYGDGILVLALGFWMGFRALIFVLAVGIILSSLYVFVRSGIGCKKSPDLQKDSEIPFVPFLFIGVAVQCLNHVIK